MKVSEMQEQGGPCVLCDEFTHNVGVWVRKLGDTAGLGYFCCENCWTEENLEEIEKTMRLLRTGNLN